MVLSPAGLCSVHCVKVLYKRSWLCPPAACAIGQDLSTSKRLGLDSNSGLAPEGTFSHRAAAPARPYPQSHSHGRRLTLP